MGLHFFHTMALALWVGGGIAIGAVVAPVTFRVASSREKAGEIVGLILQRFDQVIFGCILVLAITSVLMIRWYGRLSPWYAIEYVCLGLMSASAIFSATVLSPSIRSRAPTSGGIRQFQRRHQLVALSMQFNLACGAVAILFS